jgi:hypothetical protein
MSYSGYTEYLCVKGHHTTFDSWDCEEYFESCTVCRERIEFKHTVDETNGTNPDEPWTISAPKKEIGHEDKWQRDHYNNGYAIRVSLYSPLSDNTDWQKL